MQAASCHFYNEIRLRSPRPANDKIKQAQLRQGGRGKCQEASRRGGAPGVVTERPTLVHACARALTHACAFTHTCALTHATEAREPGWPWRLPNLQQTWRALENCKYFQGLSCGKEICVKLDKSSCSLSTYYAQSPTLEVFLSSSNPHSEFREPPWFPR